MGPRNGIIFHDGVARFLYVVGRAKDVGTGARNAGYFVLHGFEERVKGVLLLSELADPAGAGALEEHGHVIALALEVISSGKRIERPACGLFGAVLRVRKHYDCVFHGRSPLYYTNRSIWPIGCLLGLKVSGILAGQGEWL